jgi:transcriptional regulator with XRE-family HTH domain
MLSSRIRETRAKLGLSQGKLSALSGVSLPTIQNIEAGKGNPSFETLESLCKSLCLSLAFEERQPDLELLIAAGLPLSSEKVPLKTLPSAEQIQAELCAVCLMLTKHPENQERLKEAVLAFLACIRFHFPTWYKKNLSRVPIIHPFEIEKLSGRIIKLSRQARENLSKVL